MHRATLLIHQHDPLYTVNLERFPDRSEPAPSQIAKHPALELHRRRNNVVDFRLTTNFAG
jgi:hypothetical protein